MIALNLLFGLSLIGIFASHIYVSNLNKQNDKMVQQEKNYGQYLHFKFDQAVKLREKILAGESCGPDVCPSIEQVHFIISETIREIEINNNRPKTVPTYCYLGGYKNRRIICVEKTKNTEFINTVFNIFSTIFIIGLFLKTYFEDQKQRDEDKSQKTEYSIQKQKNIYIKNNSNYDAYYSYKARQEQIKEDDHKRRLRMEQFEKQCHIL